MAKFDIVHKDDMERNGKWFLARRSLNLKAFGMNIVEIKPGEKIPEHDEVARDQEEVFVVLAGTPTMIIDGKEYPTKPDTFIRLDLEPKRYMKNDGQDTVVVLIISVPRTSGYTPLDWA